MISNGPSHTQVHGTVSTDSGISTRVEDVPSLEDERFNKPVIDEPCPLQIITTDEERHTFTLDEEALESVLLRDDVAGRKVAVISVAGAFRKGKSFLLNFFLRFLQGDRQQDRWMGEESWQLHGFSWRGGCERETSGILMWSEPFFVKLPSGEDVVVLLMDTQGAFDSQSTVKDCATIFALSTMVSSVQIYNLSQNVQEDDLQHLQLFTEYGRLALQASESKPFQTLTFLVRDWSFPYEAEYGFAGGAKILERRLQVSDKQHHELQQLRQHIRLCFSDINCFLMPHPGLRVATSPEFKGQLSEIETEFKKQLKVMVPRLLSPDGLVLKEVNGRRITGRELMEYFRVYINIFQGEDLPEPKSMLLATAEANNLAALAVAKAEYVRGMEELCGGDTPYMSSAQLEEYHEAYRNRAVRKFKETRKMGGDDYSLTFVEKLDAEIWESYENFIKVNNGKNLFRSARTPAVLFVLLIIVYVCQEVFQFLYLDAIAKLCGAMLGLIFMTLSIWAYTRYSGNLREIGQSIDELATVTWENFLSPASDFLMKEGVKHAVNLQQKINEPNGNEGVRRSTSSTAGRVAGRTTSSGSSQSAASAFKKRN